ncbi:hypothetical protein BH20ACT6_BH20ACT6_02960 [soil metagenome]
MNDVYTTMVGFVGTDVDYYEGSGSHARATFRLASTSRYFDASQGGWRDRETVWLTVKAWRWLALNVSSSVRKGEPVIVFGRLTTHVWRDEHNEERSRLELEAIAIGHDLTRGTSAFLRRRKNGQAEQQAPNGAGDQPRRHDHDPAGDPDRAGDGSSDHDVDARRWPQPVVPGEQATAPQEVVTT